MSRIGLVEDVWRDYLWPEIKRKMRITLRNVRKRLVHRPRSFELLGFDVIFDAELTPWILEVNMSPAMAHRTAHQCRLIRCMSRGLVELGVNSHFLGVPAEAVRMEMLMRQDEYPHEMGCSSDDTHCSSSTWEPLQAATADAESADVASAAAVAEDVADAAAIDWSHDVDDWQEIPQQHVKDPAATSLQAVLEEVYGSRGGGRGPSLLLEGRSISRDCIERLDRMCSGYNRLLLLQR